jgi:SAM-dependent methyltransferase
VSVRETPGPVPEVGRHYQGEAGERYYAYQEGGAGMEALTAAERFRPFLAPTDTVVDFGCGGGQLLEHLDAARRLGIEPNDAARRAAAARGLEVVPSSGDLPARIADVVISNHALEHTLGPLEELRRLRALLRPHGRLVLCLPIDDWRTQRRPRPDPNHHLYTWTPQLLANLLEEAGYGVQRVDVIAYALPYHNALLHRHLPPRAFDVVCGLWARLRRQRQLLALAVLPA